MQKHTVLILLCLLALPLTGVCNQLSEPASAQEPRRSAPVNDEATAIEVAVEYFKKNIDPSGPGDAMTGPQVLNDSERKQWIVSWSFTNGVGRTAIVVNAETGKAYQADTGTD
ncbi:MAG TPA: hypothetical protein VFX02_11355 [Gammaproteobacteria bacterium]|nr:hypothetical protein [Gammaproteobacteria bacterium]